MLTIGDRFNYNAPSILSLLRKRYGDIYTVHRLDKDTSGLVVFARNETAHRNLSVQFEAGDVNKQYIAFVEGKLVAAGTINEPIAVSVHKRNFMVVHRKGKPSITKFETIGIYGNISEVKIQLLTGRTHQIRVHFNYIGHPLLIDPKYGRHKEFYLSTIKGRRYHKTKDKIERPLVRRLTLHATELSFKHPTTDSVLEYTVPLPKDLKALKYQLEKEYG